MKRITWKYILLVVVAIAGETIMGRFSLGQWFTPLLYVAPLVLLPTAFPQIAALMLGLALGLAGDIVMGTVWLNVIAAMATAMLRRPLMRYTIDDAILRKRIPVTPSRVGSSAFWGYASLLIGTHCVIFFAFETLTFHHILYTLGRVAVAWLAVILFTLLISPIIPRHDE